MEVLLLEQIIQLVNENKDKFNNCCDNHENNANILGKLIYTISSFYNSHNKNIIKNEHFNNFINSNSIMYNANITIIPKNTV